MGKVEAQRYTKRLQTAGYDCEVTKSTGYPPRWGIKITVPGQHRTTVWRTESAERVLAGDTDFALSE